jgi:hypothetical protein
MSAGDEGIIPKTVKFITTQGRMKFVRPLYRALYESPMGKDVALQTFAENAAFYHPIAAKMLAKDLGVTLENGDKNGTASAGGKDAASKKPKGRRSSSMTGCSIFNPAMVLCAGAVLVGYAYTRSSRRNGGGGGR